jgi:NAD dependent epimerase/dehydratase family enzyme
MAQASASAIGWYGAQGDAPVTEQSAANDEYQHRLCRDWEHAALEAQALGVRTACLRIGLVVGPKATAAAKAIGAGTCCFRFGAFQVMVDCPESRPTNCERVSVWQ